MGYLPRPQYLKAVDGALKVRARAGYEANEPLCVYDLAAKLGLEVRFQGGNSFGGMYAKDFEQILVPAKRPPGRQAYTCAHEIGHWYFRHGTKVEQIDELDKGGESDPDERMADIFASYLLMPQWAVADAIRRRAISPSKCRPVDCYKVANQLGIGYSTAVQQFERLRLLNPEKTAELLRTTPKDVRYEVLGATHNPHLIIADQTWWGVPIDLSVGDAVVMPASAKADKKILRPVATIPHGMWMEAVSPGVTQVASPAPSHWQCEVRVARRNYTGRSVYRFLEDSDVE